MGGLAQLEVYQETGSLGTSCLSVLLEGVGNSVLAAAFLSLFRALFLTIISPMELTGLAIRKL